MKHLKYFFSFLIIFLIFKANTFGYLLWFKSSDNTVQNIQQIEEKYVINLPIVSFIFDPRGDWIIKTMDSLNKELGEKRIYHITLSPNMYSSAQVASWAFDKQYTAFFESIKRNNLKVVFRTMHEMNGGRYPRSSDPKNFQKA